MKPEHVLDNFTQSQKKKKRLIQVDLIVESSLKFAFHHDFISEVKFEIIKVAIGL